MARSAQVQEPRKNGEAKIAINAKHLLLKGWYKFLHLNVEFIEFAGFKLYFRVYIEML